MSEKKAEVIQKTDAMFSSVADYLKAELNAVSEDYLLLERMNDMAAAKYADMTSVAGDLVTLMNDLQLKYAELGPFLKQIDELDENLTQVEQTVDMLDKYSRDLETKFQSLDRTALKTAVAASTTTTATTTPTTTTSTTTTTTTTIPTITTPPPTTPTTPPPTNTSASSVEQEQPSTVNNEADDEQKQDLEQTVDQED